MKIRNLIRFFVIAVTLAAVVGVMMPETPSAEAAKKLSRKAKKKAQKEALAWRVAQAAPAGALVADLPRNGDAPAPALSAAKRRAFLERITPMLGSGLVSMRMAENLGMTNIMGKRLTVPSFVAAAGKQVSPVAGYDINVRKEFDPAFPGSQNEPSIAAHPFDPDILVAFTHNDDNMSGVVNACSIYISFNGGWSFFYDSDVPLTTGAGGFCSDPVVRYSPDGTVVTFSYMDINAAADVSNIRLHRRDGFDPTTGPPSGPDTTTPFLDSGQGHFFDKNWHDVHKFDAADGVLDGAAFIYATVTRFTVTDDCEIFFNRSSDYGETWDGGTGLLIDSVPCSVTVVQGSRPVGGPGQQVLICYYDSATDGWSPGFNPCSSSLLIGAETKGSCGPATKKKVRSTRARQCRPSRRLRAR